MLINFWRCNTMAGSVYRFCPRRNNSGCIYSGANFGYMAVEKEELIMIFANYGANDKLSG